MFWNSPPLLFILRAAAFTVIISHFFPVSPWLGAAFALILALGMNWLPRRGRGA